MELFTKLYGAWLLFTYHCYDRIVISGYLMGMQRCGQVVYWLQNVLGITAIDKAALSKRTGEYTSWVEAFARKQKIPLEWWEKGVNKEEYVRPYLQKAERSGRWGVYFIFQTMEQGWTFRPGLKKVEQEDGSQYPILHRHRSRYRYYYFYLRDPEMGPMILRMGTFLPFEASYWVNGHSFIERQLERQGVKFDKRDNAFVSVEDVVKLQKAADAMSGEVIRKRLDYWTFVLGPKFSKEDRKAANLERSYFVHQVEYCRNFIFKRNHPIRKLFERSCELGLWRLTGDKIVEIFGRRSRERLSGKLETALHRIEHGAHVFRAYWKWAMLKQYEKYARLMRNELTSNNLRDFGLKKGLTYLGEAREKFLGVLDRFAAVQAENLNVHEDFALVRRIALPVQQGKVRVPGIRIQDVRVMRLLEVMLHAGTVPGGWTAAQIHEAVVGEFRLARESYVLNSLRYDLRKLKGHGLVERVKGKYAYRLTETGQQVAILFLLFHKWLAGPLAGSRFLRRPKQENKPRVSKLEAAYYKADQAIDRVMEVLNAA
jgi:hypothetical protein